MPYELRQWPGTVYPREVEEFPEADPAIVVAFREMAAYGPSPDGYNPKNLGKAKNYLWQINLRVDGKQIRILYAPYKNVIVVFRIHKKGSPAEQQRAYELAMKRKATADAFMKAGSIAHAQPITFH